MATKRSYPTGERSLFPGAESASSPRRGSRNALCLWLPTFELRLELVRSPELDSTSVALLSPEGGVRRALWQVSERAFHQGVRPGQLVSQAVSLCPSLSLLEPDPAHYDAAHECMIETLAELTPVVEPEGRGRGFLGMDGLDRLFGSPRDQSMRALEALLKVFPAPLVASFRAGWAPGKFAAWVAAAAAPSGSPMIVTAAELLTFLSKQPVGALPVSEEMLDRLERLGIRTLARLVSLPAPALTAQFGDEGTRARAWATGERIDPVRARHRPRPIRVSLDFPVPVGQTDTLHSGLDRLIERALSRPARQGRSVLALRVGAQLEGGGSWSTEVILREPSSDKNQISFALRSRMALQPPTRAVESLALEVFQFGPQSQQAGFFDRKEASARDTPASLLAEGEVPQTLKEAVKELKLKLGHSPLYRVVEVDPWSRIPERRHALMSFEP
jgi:nucleotidyltransferase/DNA polymerase involved in DNA repair